MKTSVSVLGIGAMTAVGRDLEVIRRALDGGILPAGEIRRVDDALLMDVSTASAMRRADRFTRMAYLAARDAWESSKKYCEGLTAERIGLILSSGFGPHCRGFKFLDGILDEGDMAASPTDFSHSVHGAASAYISRLLGIRGPALNITDFEIGFEEAIAMARCWLEEGACERVLVGAVEELGEVMLSCVSRMGGEERGISPGEGAVFLMLGKADLEGIGRLDVDDGVVDVVVMRGPSVFDNGGRERRSVRVGRKKYGPVSAAEAREIAESGASMAFTEVFGDSASSIAFSMLGALLGAE